MSAGVRRRLMTGALATIVTALAGACTMTTPDNQNGTDTSRCAATGPTSRGVSAPASPGPEWQQIFVDDFDRCDLGDNWGTYSGSPGGNPVGTWDASMVAVGNGVLRLGGERTSDGWVTGGVSNYPVTQTYGRWEIRMRADPSADLSYHMLLWPKNEQWPPEIDFAESISSQRSEMSAFVHWRDGTRNKKAQADTTGRFGQWHTVGVEWLPGLIRYLFDGRVWAEVRSHTMVPDTPMWLGMQVEAGACERREDWGMRPCTAAEPRPSTAAVEIDWVSVYRPSDEFARLADSYFSPTPGATQLVG